MQRRGAEKQRVEKNSKQECDMVGRRNGEDEMPLSWGCLVRHLGVQTGDQRVVRVGDWRWKSVGSKKLSREEQSV